MPPIQDSGFQDCNH